MKLWEVTFQLPNGRTESYTVCAETEDQAKALAIVKRKVDKAFS